MVLSPTYPEAGFCFGRSILFVSQFLLTRTFSRITQSNFCRIFFLLLLCYGSQFSCTSRNVTSLGCFLTSAFRTGSSGFSHSSPNSPSPSLAIISSTRAGLPFCEHLLSFIFLATEVSPSTLKVSSASDFFSCAHSPKSSQGRS